MSDNANLHNEVEQINAEYKKKNLIMPTVFEILNANNINVFNGVSKVDI